MTLPKSDPDSAQKAAEILLQGKIAILPTDTIYGFSGLAVLGGKKSGLDAKIDQIKKSAVSKPLIELISDPLDIYKHSDQKIPQKLFQKWPGPLTIIVKNNSWYAELTGRATTAFRCPGDEWLRKVIALCSSPVYSTSVNYTGSEPLLAQSDIEREFAAQVPLFVSDGDKGNAQASTLVSLESGQPRVLRQGSARVD